MKRTWADHDYSSDCDSEEWRPRKRQRRGGAPPPPTAVDHFEKLHAEILKIKQTMGHIKSILAGECKVATTGACTYIA